jgi:mono/diheme cytochrome c family protein
MPVENDPADPRGIEVLFYFGTGAFLALVLVATIGLSIYGHEVSADSRADRMAEDAAIRDTAVLGEGAEIFSLRCSSCHGSSGEGGVGPSFVGVTERIPDVVDHEAVVRDGRAVMPAFAGVLSDAQIELVVRFERDELDAG